MLKDKTKLSKKVITNKRGHKQTVWVKTDAKVKEQKYDFPVYYPRSGNITEDFKRHLLLTLYDQGFRRFTRLVRKHINPHYSDDMLRAGAGHTMTFKELASYHLSDADPVLYGDTFEGTDDHKFKELAKEVGVNLPKPNKANSYLK